MSTGLLFLKLNDGWNADPVVPYPATTALGPDLILRFRLNPYQFPQFAIDDEGAIRFIDCSRFRLGSTNDEGWYLGQCRYSKSAPSWGEFYEIVGADPRLDEPGDWKIVSNGANVSRHFLFYFKEETFECLAADWLIEPSESNKLFRHPQSN